MHCSIVVGSVAYREQNYSLHFVVIKNNIVTTANIYTIHLDHGRFSNQILWHLATTYMKGNSH